MHAARVSPRRMPHSSVRSNPFERLFFYFPPAFFRTLRKSACAGGALGCFDWLGAGPRGDFLSAERISPIAPRPSMGVGTGPAPAPPPPLTLLPPIVAPPAGALPSPILFPVGFRAAVNWTAGLSGEGTLGPVLSRLPAFVFLRPARRPAMAPGSMGMTIFTDSRRGRTNPCRSLREFLAVRVPDSRCFFFRRSGSLNQLFFLDSHARKWHVNMGGSSPASRTITGASSGRSSFATASASPVCFPFSFSWSVEYGPIHTYTS
mmetsp:Transcript_2059/g.4781  ORF Transcript_2059/g.4781 Transcript_2059/m.4781 type:complete len:262 (+) Transcript_2059:117-902(+)